MWYRVAKNILSGVRDAGTGAKAMPEKMGASMQKRCDQGIDEEEPFASNSNNVFSVGECGMKCWKIKKPITK